MVLDEKVLVDDKYYQIAVVEESNIMKVTNKGFATVDKFIENSERILEEIKKHRTKKIISDGRKMKAITKEHQDYITEKWIIEVVQSGVTKIASIMPEDVFGQMGSNAVSQKIETQRIGTLEMATFDNMEDAEKWIQ
ncbi:MAG: hypothetical protein ACFB15_14485 [Cyclobacteriaceae bacterium]